MIGLAPPQQGLAGGTGLVPVQGLAQMQENERKESEATQAQPLIQGLAAHVRRCFDTAQTAKQQTCEPRLLQCIRQRRGEYDPEKLTEIRKSGGSEIYMMLTANKCRSAGSWVKDVLFGTKGQAPWTVEATREPDLAPMDREIVAARAAQEAMMAEAQTGSMITPQQMKDFVTKVRDEMMSEMRERARQIMDRMQSKMEDQLQEGGFYEALAAFVDDLVTFPFAMMKGPVPRKKKALKWSPGQGGQFEMAVEDEIRLCWDRVDPFMIYWAPYATHVDDGYMIERHKLTRGDLQEMDGVDGYDSAAIKSVLEEYGKGGLSDWLSIDSEKAQAEGKSVSALMGGQSGTIDALQYWGSVQGQELLDFGLSAEEVPDATAEYQCEVWVIGRYVIKAMLNPDPCGRKPYYKTSYENIPGSWEGNGVADLVRDTQAMCNAAARALSNNMGIASGPQSYVNVDRLAAGEDVTQMYPWRVWQTTSDQYGSSAPPVEFFQPASNAAELMAIYEKFSVLADEYSGVPRYMTGDSPAGGAGRTASGMSMLMNNAGKSIKQVISNIDIGVTQPLIERLYYYNMRYSDDIELKGDVRVVARGVNVLVAQEAAQVRMNEILNIIGASPILIDIVGEEAIADLLREITRPLNMDIVPPKEVIRARMLMRQQMQMMALMAGAQPQEKDAGGGRVMPDRPQLPHNRGPATANFVPQRRPQ